MVRRGQPYRKASQKGPRGGKTRREQLRESIQEEHRKMREQNLVKIQGSTKTIELFIDDKRHMNRYPIYAITKDNSKWVLRGLSIRKVREEMLHGKSRYSDIKTKARFLYTGDDPTKGVEIERFDTKQECMDKVNADSSKKVDAGEYVILPKHEPSTGISYKVDQDEYRRFTRVSRKVHG